MMELLAAVDAAPDPDKSNRYMRRVRGEAVDMPSKKSTKIENKARRWMVDGEWLAKDENLQFDTETRIVDSGKAWGDDEDPEVAALKREKIKQEKKAMVDKKRKLVETEERTKKAKREERKAKGVRGGKKGTRAVNKGPPVTGLSALAGGTNGDEDQMYWDD